MNRAFPATLVLALIASACVTVTVPGEPTQISPAITERPQATTTAGPTVAVTPMPIASSGTGPQGPAVAEEEVLSRFVALWDEGRMPYRIAAERLIQDGRLRMEGAIQGSAFEGDLHVETIGLEATIDLIIIDGVAWLLDPVLGWYEAGDDVEMLNPINPLATGIETFDYLRVQRRGDNHFHLLRSTEWTGGPLGGPLRKLRIVSSVFDLYVTDDGVPVEGSIEFVATGRAFGFDDWFESARINYEFSSVGEPVNIEVPDNVLPDDENPGVPS